MLSFAFYLLKVIICSTVLFGYYWFFLRNKIFHSYNRFYLLAIVVLSLALPVMKINVWHKANEPQLQVIRILQVVNSSDEYMDEVVLYSHYNHISKEEVFSVLYFLVSAVFLFVLVQALFRIWRLLKKSPATIVEDIHFIRTNAKGTPFSFLKFIFWNDAIDIETKTGRQVFKHEVAHVQEKHSHDKLFLNIVLIFFWCNPFFWLIRKELNMIHEFIADKKAVEDGDTADFANMILQATYPQYRFPIANNFFYSPIKRRLLMLTKKNKTKMNYISRLLVLPLAIIVFAAFTIKAKTYSERSANKTITVVIDAGHGGNDAGAFSAEGVKEKDLALSFAKTIKALNNNENIKLIFTREIDIYQSPQEKVAFAKSMHADLFISIHFNNVPRNDPSLMNKTGVEVFISKAGSANTEKSKTLASAIINVFQNNFGLPVSGSPMQSKHGIQVLQTADCPAVIIEAGYLSNKKDIAYLQSEDGKELFARNVLKAIENYAASENTLNKQEQVSNTQSFKLDVDVKNTDSAYLASDELKIKALVIVDLKIIGNLGYNYIEQNLSKYHSIKVYSPLRAIKIYGEKGKYGAIELTKKNEPVFDDIPKAGPIDHDLYISGFEQTNSSVKIPEWVWDENQFPVGRRPLFILNGKEVAGIKGFNVSNDNISDLRVLIAKTAMATYGDKAKNGVVIINTQKNPVPANMLIVLDGKIYEGKNWNEVMSENDFREIDKVQLLEKEEAIKKYGLAGKDGAMVVSSRPGSPENLTFTLSGMSGSKIHISQLKNVKQIQLTSADYTFKHATVYFSGKGFSNVEVRELNDGSLISLQPYFSRVVAGTNVTFDNVKIQKKGSNDIMEIARKAFLFYDKNDSNPSNQDRIFTKVEIEPDFPGGSVAWQDFLKKNLNARMPVDEGWKPGVYRIVVQFIVDADGNISDVKTNDHPTSKTAKQCIDLIKNGPKWIPAKQNGRSVKAYKKQPITFIVEGEESKTYNY